MFVNGTVGAEEDFQLRAGSPAIDAGVSDPFDGSTDLDGAPRVQGVAIDLGAYELAPPPPVPPAGSAPGGGGVVPGTSTPPLVARAPATITLLAHTVNINASRHTGSLSAACAAKADDTCAVVGSLASILTKAKSAAHKKPSAAVRLGTISGSVRGAQHGALTVRLTAAALALLHKRGSLSASATGTVTSLGGTSKLSGRVQLTLAPSHRKR